MISIKDRSVMFGLLSVEYHPALIEILMWLAGEYPEQVVFTCGHRPGDSGVHGTDPCRGMDIRSWAFKRPDRVCNYINMVFEYDHERPEKKASFVHQNRGEEGTHIHIQVHPNTRRRK